MTKPLSRGLGLLLLIGSLYLAYSAGRQAIEPAGVVEAAQSQPAVEVSEQTLESSLTTPVRISWLKTEYPSPITGIVTRAPELSLVQVGEAVVEIDLEPVTAIEGDTPLTRSIKLGTKGRDVEVLQNFLSALGFLEPSRADAEFGRDTLGAYQAWLQSVGQELSTSVEPGRFLVLPEMPAYVAVAEGVGVGRKVEVGADLVEVIEATPVVRMPLLEAQARMLDSLPVSVATEYEGSSLEGLATEIVTSEESGTELVVEVDVGVCGDSCPGVLPIGDPVQLVGEIQLQPPVTGIAVPISAILIGADGGTFVYLAGGQRVDVGILAEDGRFAIVTGISAGDMIQIYAE